MQELLDQYRAGVLIQGIAIRQVDPPSQVDEAFKEVTAARQERESAINLARAYEQQVLERARSEEHTSELQSLMRISYAVFCLKKKNTRTASNQALEVNKIQQD